MNFELIVIKVIADWLIIPILLIAGLAMLRLPAHHRYEYFGRGIITGLVALLLAKIASLLYQGPRPFETLGAEPLAAYLDNPGFPSDHALLVFTVTCIVWASTKNKTLAGLLLVLSCLVALGRVLALVHTGLDVTVGALCAVLAACCIYGRSFWTAKKRP